MGSLSSYRPTDEQRDAQGAGIVYMTLEEAFSAYCLELDPRRVSALKTTIRHAQTLRESGYWLEPCDVEGRYMIRGGRTFYVWDARERTCSCDLFRYMGTCKHSIAAEAGELPILQPGQELPAEEDDGMLSAEELHR